MVKTKTAKSTPSVPQKNVHSRISYLYQASLYLQAQQDFQPTKADEASKRDTGNDIVTATSAVESAAVTPLSRHLLSQMRSISLKSQIRLSQNVKQSVCKRCDTFLQPGISSKHEIENKSRGQKKPWADVLVVTCTVCGAAKRYPMGQKRQLRRQARNVAEQHLDLPVGQGKDANGKVPSDDIEIKT